MKKILTACITMLLTTQAYSQVGEPRNDLSFGVNGGVALNKISFNPSIKQQYHEGITLGITTRYTCEKYFNMLCALQGEINFTQMGWKEDIETSTDTYSRTINYVQVPLLAHLGFGKERGGVKGFLVLGPQIGYYISDKEKKSGEWSERTLSLRPNLVTAQYNLAIQKKFEYGLTGGAGMDISTRSGHHFILEGRYFFALSDVFNNSKKDTFGRSANGAIIAKVSYLFDVIKTRH